MNIKDFCSLYFSDQSTNSINKTVNISETKATASTITFYKLQVEERRDKLDEEEEKKLKSCSIELVIKPIEVSLRSWRRNGRRGDLNNDS